MATKKVQGQFDAIVKRRDELKDKRRLSRKEKIELGKLENTLEAAPTADKLQELQEAFVHGQRQVARGDAFVLTDDVDFEAFKAWLEE